MPDRYLIDYWRDERRRQPLAVACDSHRLRKAYHNRVVSGPAQPLPAEFVRLLHPAWLLSGWKLTAAGQGTVGGRAVFRVIAELPPRAPGLPVQPERSSDRPRDRPPDAALRIIVMVDAELGILLRQVSFVDAQPAVRFELRDVSCHRSAKAADFALRAAPALPVIDSDGEPLDDLDLHPLVRAAGEAADTVLAGLQTALGRLSAQVRRAKDASAGRWP